MFRKVKIELTQVFKVASRIMDSLPNSSPGETMYLTLVVVVLTGIALGVLIPLAVPERAMG
jgi:hypothetical protein